MMEKILVQTRVSWLFHDSIYNSPLNYENTSLIVMVKKYYFNHDRWLIYKKNVIVRMVPEFDEDIPQNSEKWKSFCRQQALLFHHYRRLEEAKGPFQSWSEQYISLGYETCQIMILPELINDDVEVIEIQRYAWNEYTVKNECWLHQWSLM